MFHRFFSPIDFDSVFSIFIDELKSAKPIKFRLFYLISPLFSWNFVVYPRVKAKDKTINCNQSGSCLNSNYLQSRASENKQEEDLHIIVAKIPKIYIPSVLMSESESKDMKKHIRGAEIEKKRRGAEIEPIQKSKTIPVLRPRAVVSSPDNDALIGSINKSEENKAKTGLKSNGHVSKRASQRKNIDTNVKFSHRPVATKSGTSLKDHK
ncbi:BnaC03g64660D [Brassica napus]|uniref:Uncharacterized protein n=3 Tax=Brassica TaxID=3705 RepID=A0A3P6B052_BRAOL|nr:unnamed protein product [Brassica napus]CDY27426.1 BnaC03g64660D [Brassica napus]VDC99676.1 unnamed protein product [Brassica oleracea]